MTTTLNEFYFISTHESHGSKKKIVEIGGIQTARDTFYGYKNTRNGSKTRRIEYRGKEGLRRMLRKDCFDFPPPFTLKGTPPTPAMPQLLEI